MSRTENRKELTKHLIAASFKDLLVNHPFEKISIKMIVDGADIRRPSFYNHFLDKYDLLEWIAATEIVAPALQAMDTGKEAESWRLLLGNLRNSEAFYRKAFGVTGQNGFEEAFVRQLTPLVKSWLARDAARTRSAPLSEDRLATVYALIISTAIKAWLLSGLQADTDQLLDMARYLAGHMPAPPEAP